ncbi:hypothetical protein [Streptomyces sp. NPDC051636]|uniref:hypothetical protein n=1 Tax=Streptomyces sp. NPDC051636 TaxID=3365663 RepID=UPI00378ECAA8
MTDAQQEQILQLIGAGQNNAAIARQTGVDVRVVAGIRHAAGLPAAPRSSWARREHPHRERILELLGEGRTDTAVRQETGADMRTIARLRREGGFGPATIHNRGKRQHPKDAEIRALISAGRHNEAIVRELRVDKSAVRRIRKEMDVPNPPQHSETLEEKWAQHTEPLEGGHLRWTGSRAGASGTPVMCYRDKTHTAAAVAFRQRTGRDPVGQVKAECDLRQCVAPDHVEDEPGRTQLREQYRYLLGMGERPAFCKAGHDQAVHGRYLRTGVAYCSACSTNKKKRQP